MMDAEGVAIIAALRRNKWDGHGMFLHFVILLVDYSVISIIYACIQMRHFVTKLHLHQNSGPHFRTATALQQRWHSTRGLMHSALTALARSHSLIASSTVL